MGGFGGREGNRESDVIIISQIKEIIRKSTFGFAYVSSATENLWAATYKTLFGSYEGSGDEGGIREGTKGRKGGDGWAERGIEGRNEGEGG